MRAVSPKGLIGVNWPVIKSMNALPKEVIHLIVQRLDWDSVWGLLVTSKSIRKLILSIGQVLASGVSATTDRFSSHTLTADRGELIHQLIKFEVVDGQVVRSHWRNNRLLVIDRPPLITEIYKSKRSVEKLLLVLDPEHQPPSTALMFSAYISMYLSAELIV